MTIDEIKQIELQIMDELDRICRENGITYFLGYGSCLGAMRHGGFIPWDDDLDVVMFRDDYEKLFEVFGNERSDDRFELVSYRDETSPQAFFKICDNTTKVEERYMLPEYGSGVWVDIFPLDAVNDVSIANKRSIERNQACRYLAVTRPETGSTGLIKLGKSLLTPIFSRIGPYGFARRIDELARAGAEEGATADIVADFIAGWDIDDQFPVELFEPMEVEFEGPAHTYFVPKGYDEYLTTIYGDWRTPPAESERETHAVTAYRLR